MNLLTFSEPVQIAFQKSSGEIRVTLEAGRPYLFAQHQVSRFMQDPNMMSRVYKLSRCDMRMGNFVCKPSGHNGRLMIFNGSGGFGDQIMTWPFARLMSQWYEVHVLTDPGNTLCWWNQPHLRSIQQLPIQWDLLKLYNHLAFFEEVVNTDEHQDQEHPIDVMLRRVGIDPDSVPPEAKVMRPLFTFAEAQAAKARIDALQGKRLGLYQLSSANPVRALPVDDSVYLAVKLAETYTDTHWIALHDEFIPAGYVEGLKTAATQRGLTNIEAFKFPNLRELWAVTELASIVVAPDSMMVHAAGMFGVPCVGLWGPVDPSRRVRYYKNHHPIWRREACPHAPCFVFSSTFPRYCPPTPVARTTCECISAIAAVDVTTLVGKVRR